MMGFWFKMLCMNEPISISIPRSALWLGLAGLIPFWLMSAMAGLSMDSYRATFGLNGALAYAAVILSFLGGIRWGAGMSEQSKLQQARSFSLAVIPSLAAWSALLIPAIPAVSLLIASLLMQALWDVLSTQDGLLPAWFAKLRMILTSLAIIPLLLLLGRLLLLG